MESLKDSVEDFVVDMDHVKKKMQLLSDITNNLNQPHRTRSENCISETGETKSKAVLK